MANDPDADRLAADDLLQWVRGVIKAGGEFFIKYPDRRTVDRVKWDDAVIGEVSDADD